MISNVDVSWCAFFYRLAKMETKLNRERTTTKRNTTFDIHNNGVVLRVRAYDLSIHNCIRNLKIQIILFVFECTMWCEFE